MKINAKVDIAKLVDNTSKAQRKLAFAVTDGINETAKQIQASERENLARRFTIRTPQSKKFLDLQAAVIKPFASVKKGLLYAEVAIGQKDRLLLSGFETGVERKPVVGKVIAQPVTGSPARPGFSDPVAKQFTFKSMQLKAQQGKHGEVRYEGKRGTFTIPGIGVFVRNGKGKRDIELLYAYARHQKLPKKLGWISRAKAVADTWLEENITRAFLKSLKK